MLRRRIEKLEAHLPVAAGRLLEGLDRQALNALSFRDRELASEMLRPTTSRRRVWSQEHHAAEANYLQNFGVLLKEVSDDDLANMIARLERELGRPIPAMEAIV
jgi:hypothetical protein